MMTRLPHPSLLDLSLSSFYDIERMARYRRHEGLNNWLTLESWLGMLIDAIFFKARSKTEEEEATIDVRKLVPDVQSLYLDSLKAQVITLSTELISKAADILIAATNRYNRVVKGEEEGPTPAWLNRYFCKEIVADVYKAWDKKDLVWAVYSYFFWKAPERTDEGFEEALAELMDISHCTVKEQHQIAAVFGVTARIKYVHPPKIPVRNISMPRFLGIKDDGAMLPSASLAIDPLPSTRATPSLVAAVMGRSSSAKISPAP